MFLYILKRFIIMVPVLLGVTLVVYIIMSVAPGDPARIVLGEYASDEAVAKLHTEMGLDDPLIVQYGRYIVNILKGDFGTSYKTGKPVADEIWSRFPNTVLLSIVALTFAIIVSIPLGVIAAVKQNTWFDTSSMIFSLIGISTPAFWLALILLLLFSLKLGWLPSQGMGTWKNLILPGFSLGFLHLAAIARTTRSSMLETTRQDYIRTAQSKGVPKKTVIRRHALKNALIPTITIIGLQAGALLSGAVLTETVFAWPGIGRYIVISIQARDIPSILGCIILFTICFSIVNLIVDLLYGLVDPRIRTQY